MIAGDRPKTSDLYTVGIIKELSAACATKSTIWMELGLTLSLDQTDLNIIEANNRHDVQRCCLTMFNHWLDKHSNANWETLRKALVDVELEQLASRIKQRLSVPMFSSNTTDPSNADVSIGKKLRILFDTLSLLVSKNTSACLL